MQRPSVTYPSGSYHDLVLRHARRDPARPALVFEARSMRLGELDDGARRLAAGLRGLGLRAGDRLALCLPNGVEAVLAFLAVSMAGAAAVPMNPSYREREVRHLLADSGAATLIVGEDQWPVVAAARESAPGRGAVVVTGTARDPRCVPFAELLAAPAPGPHGARLEAAARDADPGHRRAAPSPLALLPYSSGTTGLPKGVMLTHANLVATMVQFASALDVGPDDVLVNFLPLAHIYGLMVTGVALASGATVLLMERFDLDTVLTLIERHRATMLFAVPPVITALCEHPDLGRHDLSSLRLINTGAAPQSPEVIRRAARLTGIPVITGYGLTEAAPVAHSPVPPRGVAAGAAEQWSATRAGGVGFAVSDTELRIVDAETGLRALPPGEAGELVVRGPQVMQGYWNRPEETAAVLSDGWLRTGDLARRDADGYVAIVGRTKEIIKSRGFSIAPAEIEAVLLEHPAVADCAVVGRPDADRGEVPVAFVALRGGAGAVASDLLDFAAARLAGYKRLHAVVLVPAIPRTPAGKVLRQALAPGSGEAER